jgi:hypothetical protein
LFSRLAAAAENYPHPAQFHNKLPAQQVEAFHINSVAIAVKGEQDR